MGFRKEVRVFIADMRLLSKAIRDFIKLRNLEMSVMEKVIERQKEEISDLHAKLLARDLPELKTYHLTTVGEELPKYNPEEDEGLAGEIANP